MSEIINKLKDNQFNRVDNANKTCPICDGDLYCVDNWMMVVMDGDAVYHCENNEEHIFWKHPFERKDILHLNKNASETNFTSEQDYEFINGSWDIC